MYLLLDHKYYVLQKLIHRGNHNCKGLNHFIFSPTYNVNQLNCLKLLDQNTSFLLSMGYMFMCSSNLLHELTEVCMYPREILN